ncbi:MAG TPA: UDP-N-acetylglucosamine 4,6-dehydratase (inverting) [Polyangia bacterium]|nr:UDP-N-acetylglucosamine 4,6-dehydratase (inverting) [Polyangia bacterium]HWE30654.1 UDP-N-acetylglucosamine 4,6-dehydratase (inverting) [Polyangia bacterium]
MYSLEGKALLVTGGTGSFGKLFVKTAMERLKLRRIVVYSRDELKQYEMQQKLDGENLRYFIGDVRDQPRLGRALDGIDVVVHAAALKQVPACEYNPFEAVKTNILGAENVINESIDRGVKRVLALSTDKAANPINLYGATKLCSDKLFVAGNAYVGKRDTRFAVVRYGNVVGSRGSVIPFFLAKKKTGVLPITDPRMTRFWITLQQGVDFVIDSIARMSGGEIFVPKIPSMNIMDLAQAVAPECKTETVGIRPGEKLHEVMVPEDDARSTVELADRYVIKPTFAWFPTNAYTDGKPCADNFRYGSDTNDRWLTRAELTEMVRDFKPDGLE